MNAETATQLVIVAARRLRSSRRLGGWARSAARSGRRSPLLPARRGRGASRPSPTSSTPAAGR